jgi:hypothetical protein
MICSKRQVTFQPAEPRILRIGPGPILPYLLAFMVLGPTAASAGSLVLAHTGVSIAGTGGSGGSGTSASDMIYNQYTSSDGWGWAGGAGGVQGGSATTNTGGHSTSANETFGFNIGSTIDALNAAYGTGNWTVANPTLTFNSSYSVQNNSRFGIGSGNFDIYWVANDNWAQSKGTPTDRQSNPVYASSEPVLQSWAGSDSLLGSEIFTVPTGGLGYVALSYNLASDPSFVNDIVSASASSDPKLSLYLMGMSDTLGMIIFTGGQSQSLPTLSFDVVSTTAVPEPVSWAIASVGAIGLWLALRTRRRRL